MKVLLIGASGFIGSNLLPVLCKSHKVLAFSRKPVSLKHKNLSSIQGDISNLSSLENAFSSFKPEIVLHFATANAFGSEEECRKTDIEGTKNIVELCKKFNSKLVFLSSIFADYNLELPYSKAKKEAENIVQNSSIPFIILKLSGTFTSESIKSDRLASFVKKFNIVPLIAGGNEMTQLVHLEDVLNAILSSISCKQKNKSYYLCGYPITYKRYAEIVSKALGKKPFFLSIPFFLASLLFSKTRIEIAKQNKVFDIRDGRKDLNFEPKSLEEVLNC